MKKSKLILVLAAVMALTCLLSACGVKTAEFEDVCVNGAYTDKSTTYTKAELINVAGEFVTASNGIALFKDGSGEKDVYHFYNLMTNAVVQTVTDTDTVTYFGFVALKVNDGVVFVIKLKDTTTAWKTKYTTTLYKADGTQIASAADSVTPSFNGSADLLVFNNTYYPVDADGNIGEGFEYPAFSNVPSIDHASANYYYDMSGNSLYVYDKQFKLVAEYTMPSYAMDMEGGFHVLENGNVLLQYLVQEPDDAEDYDVFFENYQYREIEFGGGLDLSGGIEETSNVKATIVTQLINVEKDTIKDINLDYFVMEVYTKTDIADKYSYMSEEIENLAYAVEIVDGRIDGANAKLIALTNKCKAEMVLNDVFVAQGTGIPTLIAENRYMITDKTGAQYIVNEKGEKLGRVDTMNNKNEAYFVVDGKIYNFDCAMVLDCKKEGYTITYTLEKGYIMTKAVETGTETYAFFNGTATKIIDAGDATKTISVPSARYYVIKTVGADGTTYDFYNDCGTKLVSLAGALAYKGSGDNNNVLLFSYYDAANSKTVYYRFA